MVQHIPSLQGAHPQGQRKEECTPHPVNPPLGPDQPDEGREGQARTCNAQKDGVLRQGPRRESGVGEDHETDRFACQVHRHGRQEINNRLWQDDQNERKERQEWSDRCGHHIGWEKGQRKPAKRRQRHRQREAGRHDGNGHHGLPCPDRPLSGLVPQQDAERRQETQPGPEVVNQNRSNSEKQQPHHGQNGDPIGPPAQRQDHGRHRRHGRRPQCRGTGATDHHVPPHGGKGEQRRPPPACTESTESPRQQPHHHAHVKPGHCRQVCQPHSGECVLDLPGHSGTVACGQPQQQPATDTPCGLFLRSVRHEPITGPAS